MTHYNDTLTNGTSELSNMWNQLDIRGEGWDGGAEKERLPSTALTDLCNGKSHKRCTILTLSLHTHSHAHHIAPHCVAKGSILPDDTRSQGTPGPGERCVLVLLRAAGGVLSFLKRQLVTRKTTEKKRVATLISPADGWLAERFWFYHLYW